MKKNYFTGILGALIGGVFACIPWIIVYVYLNLMYSFLASFIAAGALYGYQLFKGKIDKKVPLIITIVSVLSITVATLIIIPSLIIIDEGLPLTLANLEYLYSSSEFIGALIKDYIVSIIFTFLGIGGVIINLKAEIDKNPDKVKISINNNSKEERELIKKFFVENNALSSENAISIDSTTNININTLNILRNQNIVLYADGKFYYSILGESNFNKKQSKILKIGKIVIIFGIIVMVILTAIGSGEDSSNEDVSKKKVYYSVSSSYKEYIDEDNDDSWFYVPKKDLTGYSGYINVYYYNTTEDTYSDEWFNNYKDLVANYYNYRLGDNGHFVNKNGCDVAWFVSLTGDDYNYITYFIFGDDQIGVVDIIDYGVDKNLLADGKKMADTFYWNS